VGGDIVESMMSRRRVVLNQISRSNKELYILYPTEAGAETAETAEEAEEAE
jgi:hypothetical protein